MGERTDEYKYPVEFFPHTYLTENVKEMLVSAVRRAIAGGGYPSGAADTDLTTVTAA